MEELFKFLMTFFLIVVAIAVLVYVLISLFLNKFNKLVYGKGTILAWIPICNIYLLGKLTINKTVGWILVACIFLTSTYTTTVNGVTTVHTILPANISGTISSTYNFVVFGLFIYAIIRYNQIKKRGIIPPQNNN